MMKCKKVELRSTDLCTLYAEIDTLRQQLADANAAYDETAKAYAEAIVEIERLRKIEAAATEVFQGWIYADEQSEIYAKKMDALRQALAGDGGTR